MIQLLLLGLYLTTVSADNWAVLIAGSNYFFNYRHQSDICHAYHILTTKGNIPAENIIVMMYDDIAHNEDNPFPGKIFNHPNGTNVYKGVHIDYKGAAVNKTTFLKVLQGDQSAGGKVLQSTANDDVFIYYSDHGATGLVAMPTGDVLYADELLSALKYMYHNHMYRQLVFYMEACESGSMFHGLLPKNMNIFATTAANPDESSYAFYFWQPVNTYLGDEYSIRWMEDSDLNWNKHESLATQFAHVKKQVKESHPQEYGTMAFVNESISDFQGNDESVPLARMPSVPGQPISSRDVKLFYLMQKYATALPSMKKNYLSLVEQEIQYRATVKMHIQAVVARVLRTNSMSAVQDFMAKYIAPRDFDCLRTVKNHFTRRCEPLVEYGLSFVKNLVQLCETSPRHAIVRAIDDACT